MVTPRKKRFTMSDYYAQLDEIREKHRQKPASVPATDLIGRIRQAVKFKLPKLPN